MVEPSRESYLALERELAARDVELNEAHAYQAAIRDVLGVISESSTDLQPVFDAITERAMALCGARIGAMTRFDGELLHLVAYHGVAQEASDAMRAAFPMKLARGSISGRAILDHVPVQIPDVPADPDYALKDASRQAGIRSILAVPLLREGQVVGTILVSREETGSFPAKLVKLLQTFADQAVIAIENVRLFNETKEALEQQTATAEILKVISGSPTDLQPVFDAITERAMALCDARIGAVTRFDGELLHLVTLRGVSPEAEDAMHAAYPMEPGRSSLNARAILERAPVQCADVFDDPDYVPKDAARQAGFRGGLAVPLLREGQAVGAIWVGRAEPGLFPDKLVKLLQTFADQAVLAIENVRLFNETKEALEQQTAISEILRVISESPTDVQPVLEAIADHAARLCDAGAASIFLTEGDMLRHVASRGPLVGQTTPLELLPINRQSTSGRAVLERATMQVADMQAEAAEYPLGYEIALRLGYRTVVVAPLFREGPAVRYDPAAPPGSAAVQRARGGAAAHLRRPGGNCAPKRASV